MPYYDLICDNCNFQQELEQSIHEALPTVCPQCKGETLRQDYASKSFIVQDADPKTVGQQAERNAKKLGSEMADIEARKIAGPATIAKREAPTPFWREPGSKPLDVSKIKDVNKYIATGDMN